MSHSRIFQYSKEPIDANDYIDDLFMTSDYVWHAFEGKICGDYTDIRNQDERMEDIKWLAEHLSKLNITPYGDDKFVLGDGSHKAIKDFWYDGIKNAFDVLDKENLDKYNEKWALKYAIIDPLCHGFGFLFYNNDSVELSASDDFFEFLLRLNEGDSFYIGATLDYHC